MIIEDARNDAQDEMYAQWKRMHDAKARALVHNSTNSHTDKCVDFM